LKTIKKLLRGKKSGKIINKRAKGVEAWHPGGKLEYYLIKARDKIWQKKAKAAWEEIEGDKADLIIYDGGHGLLKFDHITTETKAKKAAFYYGSDLRFRGLMPEIDNLCEKKYTFEYDLSVLYPQLKFLFFPYDFSELKNFEKKAQNDSKRFIVGHAPTNRAAKGTEEILYSLRALQKEFDFEILLIENLPYKEALRRKTDSDFFIDQVGELGYGLNSVESLAMGIPTAVELLADFETLLRPHPFYNIRSGNLKKDLAEIFFNRQMWQEKAEFGKKWVKDKHDADQIAKIYLKETAR
jgi:hypothetical protein